MFGREREREREMKVGRSADCPSFAAFTLTYNTLKICDKSNKIT